MCIPKEIIIISVKLKLLSELVLQLCTSFEQKAQKVCLMCLKN